MAQHMDAVLFKVPNQTVTTLDLPVSAAKRQVTQGAMAKADLGQAGCCVHGGLGRWHNSGRRMDAGSHWR